MASYFAKRGFFDCELGNATPLALANILQVPLVIISSIDNVPVLHVIPRETPLTNVHYILRTKGSALGIMMPR